MKNKRSAGGNLPSFSRSFLHFLLLGSVFVGFSSLFSQGTPVPAAEGQAVPAPTKPPEEKPKEKEEFTIYEDQDGQLFTKPGVGRTPSKLNKGINKHDPKFNPYPNHLTSRPVDPQKEKLTITGRIQFRGVSAQEGSNFNNGHSDFSSVDWNFRRLRLGMQYQGSSWWGAVLNIRGENMLNNPQLNSSTNAAGQVTSVSLKDARGFIQEAAIFFNLPFWGARVSLGQLPTQFQREYLMSSANFIALERSYTTQAYPQFDDGVGIQLSPLKDYFDGKYEKHLTVNLMVGNGKGAGGDFGNGRRQDLTYTFDGNQQLITSPTYYARAQWNVFGGLMKPNGANVGWQEGEEIFVRDAKLSIGAARMQTKNVGFSSSPGSTLAIDSGVPRGYGNVTMLTPQTTPDCGTNGNYNVQSNQTTPGRCRLDLTGNTVDYTFSWRGFYLSGAYTKFTGAASNNMIGWQQTIGYNIPITERFWLMPVFRYDYMQGDFNRNGHMDPSDYRRYYWAGLNFFGDKHLFKAQLFYQIPVLELGVNPNNGSAARINNQTVYFQLQATFWTGVTSPDHLDTRLE
ncbi:hypothetical protein EHO61_07955 [Leptospira fluminis]|uniref:Porin n=1 Tax=Leptospira fluminis TaxID=2484979 RepID=A0A4R9GQC9_9LEPT|nr:hypothetical protein [Leptospira fluminis]TGK19395.1 hypothetical protein EHO61_07955 [Leptospira fluminis]